MLFSSLTIFPISASTDYLYLTGLKQKIDTLNLSISESQRYAAYGSLTDEFKYFELALLTNMYKNLYYLVGIAELPKQPFSKRVAPGTGVDIDMILSYALELNKLSHTFCQKHGEYQVENQGTPEEKITDNLRIEIPPKTMKIGGDETGTSKDIPNPNFFSALKDYLGIQLYSTIPNLVVPKLAEVFRQLDLENAVSGGENNKQLSGDFDSIISLNTELLYWTGEIFTSLGDFDNDFADLYNWNSKQFEPNPNLWTQIKNFLDINQTELSKTVNKGLKGDIREIMELISKAIVTKNSIKTNPTGEWFATLPGQLEYQIQAFANVTRSEQAPEGSYSYDTWAKPNSEDAIQLTSVYIAMLSATSIYRPFQSKVGDIDYMETLRYLTGNTGTTSEQNAEKEQIIGLFNSVKDKRKPLYFVPADTLKNVSSVESNKNLFGYSYSDIRGQATRITLQDLIQAAEEEKNIALLTVRGEFTSAPDSNSWAFYQAPLYSTFSKDENTPVNIPAERTVSGENYTRALYEIGGDPGIYMSNLLVFINAYKDLRGFASLELQKSSYLYMNVFGDIVLSDNTVIVPGAANPVIYNMEYGYNPYTVAFMNYYPKLAQDSINLRVLAKSDFGKYMILADKTDNQLMLKYFQQDFQSNQRVFTRDNVKELASGTVKTDSGFSGGKRSDFYLRYSELRFRKVQSSENATIVKTAPAVSIYPFFYAGYTDNGPRFYSMLWLANTSRLEQVGVPSETFVGTPPEEKQVALVVEQTITSEGLTLFPYSPDENIRTGQGADLYAIPKAIALNMYWYFMRDSDMKLGAKLHNDTIRSDFIFNNIIAEMLQGYEYVTAYEKNIILTDLVLDGDKEATLSKFRDVAQSLMDNIGSFDGVLGITSAYSNPIFGQVLKVLRNFFWIILAVFLVVFVIRYMKRGDMLYVAIMSVLSAVFLWMFIYIIPAYLPLVYNSAGSMLTEGLVADTVLYNAEKYSTTYGTAKILNVEGDYDTATLSITLYRMSEYQLEDFAKRFGGAEWQVFFDSFRYGGKVVLNPDIGMFIQGDCIKLNVDVLLLNNPITGSYKKGEYGYFYQLSANQLSMETLNYYFPFFDLEDGLIHTLNLMLEMYTIPRTTANYADGLVKDAYILFNYTNSAPFLYEGNYTNMPGLTPVELVKLEKVFSNAKDFLNMTEWVKEPTEEMQQSLWYNTMVKHGFYDVEYVNPGVSNETRLTAEAEKRLDDLIEYVNYHTKRYLVENQPIIGIISDENLIKVTTLQAAFYFNSYISDFGGWVYPWGFNQEELKLNDVFITALTPNNDRFIKHNFNLVDYVATSHGTWGLGFLICILFFGVMFTMLVKFSMPILYIALALLVIYRLILDRSLGQLLTGYLKATCAMAGIYTCFILILSLVPKLTSGMIMLVVLAVVNLLLFFTTIIIMLGFFGDITNLGNYGIKRALTGNPVTGFWANPISNLINNISKTVSATPVYSHAEQEVAFSGEDPQKANRRYILNSMNDSEGSGSNSTVREPRMTFSRTVLRDNTDNE